MGRSHSDKVSQEMEISFPRMKLYLVTPPLLSIILSILIVFLREVGPPPSSQGLIPTMLAAGAVLFSFAIMFNLLLLLTSLLKVNMWRSAAIAWSLTTSSTDEIKPDLKYVRKAAVLPYSMARIEPSILLLGLIIVTISLILPIFSTGIIAMTPENILLVLAGCCIMFCILIDFMHKKNEQKYIAMSDGEIMNIVETHEPDDSYESSIKPILDDFKP